MKKISLVKKSSTLSGYNSILTDVGHLLESARRASVRTTNAVMTATYWEIGRRIVEYEQKGTQRAEYGELLLEYLARDLTKKFGRGFGRENLRLMRLFYSAYKDYWISQTLSGKCDEIPQTLFAKSGGVPTVKKDQTLSGELRPRRAVEQDSCV
jgi:hypothetical protein